MILDGYDFPNKYLNCILNNNWWHRVMKIEELLIPYCSALNKIQRHNARLYEVLYRFGSIVKVLKGFNN